MRFDTKKNSPKKLKEQLELLYREFNTQNYLDTDPIGLVHQYKDVEDQEIAAFIISMITYGSARLVREAAKTILRPMGRSPARYMKEQTASRLKADFQFQYYRFYKREDVLRLLLSLQKILKRHGRLENLYLSLREDELCERFSILQNHIRDQVKGSDTYGWSYLFPDPKNGVAKRVHMFLRWVVRKDDVDLGLWTANQPSELYIPLDTHLFDIAKRLKLTQRKTLSKKTLEECTAALRKLNPQDPIRYDFSLCRLGVLNKKDEYF